MSLPAPSLPPSSPSPPPVSGRPVGIGAGARLFLVFVVVIVSDVLFRALWDSVAPPADVLKSVHLQWGMVLGAALAMTARTWVLRARIPVLSQQSSAPRVPIAIVIGSLAGLFAVMLWVLGFLDWYTLQHADLLQAAPAPLSPDASLQDRLAWSDQMARVEPLLLKRLLSHVGNASVATVCTIGAFWWVRRAGWLPQLDAS